MSDSPSNFSNAAQPTPDDAPPPSDAPVNPGAAPSVPGFPTYSAPSYSGPPPTPRSYPAGGALPGYRPQPQPTYGPPSQGYGPAYGQPSPPPYAYTQYPGAGGYGHYPPSGYAPGYPPSGPPPRRTGRKVAFGIGAALVAAALAVGGVAIADDSGSSSVAGSGSLSQVLPAAPTPGSGNSGSDPGAGTLPGGNGSGGTAPGGGSLPNGNGSGNSSSGKKAATASQKSGIVTVVSVLGYQNAESAGTGMILSSDGEVLTNNHVVDGATSLTITVVSTGKSYRAAVVGTDPSDDVAVLQLQNASGLTTAKVAQSASGVKVGDGVTGVGNGGGTGTLTAAAGKVTALNQSITATDDEGQNAETLHDLIEIDSAIIPGDSGGPLYDNSAKIIGMDTAASTTRSSSAATAAYAIPIENALSIAKQIESGVETTSIHIGLPGFLGVGPATRNGTGGGVLIGDVVTNGPADKAGIGVGSRITAIDGTSVNTSDQLHNVLAKKKPGTQVTVHWADATGTQHSASLTLVTGPAD